RPQPASMAERLDVKTPGVGVVEAQQVQRRQIARGVVEEHVLRARIARVDPSIDRTGMPLVDGAIELHAGVSAGPGGEGDLLPELAGLEALAGVRRPLFLVGSGPLRAPVQVPGAVALHR